MRFVCFSVLVRHQLTDTNPTLAACAALALRIEVVGSPGSLNQGLCQGSAFTQSDRPLAQACSATRKRDGGVVGPMQNQA